MTAAPTHETRRLLSSDMPSASSPANRCFYRVEHRGRLGADDVAHADEAQHQRNHEKPADNYRPTRALCFGSSFGSGGSSLLSGHFDITGNPQPQPTLANHQVTRQPGIRVESTYRLAY